MKTIKRLAILIILLSTLTLNPAISWSGGLALYEISTGEVGLASAGIAARAQDASTLFTNPAGMSLHDNSELLVNFQPLYLNVDFSSDDTTTTSGGDGDASSWMPGGSVYYLHNLSPDVKIGLGVLSYFGLGLDYGDSWSGRYYLEDTMLVGLTLMPSISYRMNESFSFGAGINAMYGMFENSSSVFNPVQEDGKLKVSDEDWGFGFNLGMLFEQSEGTRYGMTYMSKVDLDFKGSPEYSGPGSIPGSILSRISRLDMGMTVPQMVMASIYHELNNQWAIMGNVGWQDWSEFGKINVTAGINEDVENSSKTLNLDYDDSWHTAFGAQYRASDLWLISGGLAYDSAILDDDNRTFALPNGDAWRLGTGAQYQLRENIELGFAYELVWFGDLSVEQETSINDTVVRRVSGEFEKMYMHFFSFSAKWRF